MLTVTQTEFRNHIKKYMDAVEQGEEIQICRKGRPVAAVVPRKGSRVPHWKQGEPLKIPGVSLSKIILEDRR